MELLHSITLFGSLFWGITAILLFIALCFYADVQEEGFLATFVLIVIGALFFFWGKDTWKLFVSLLTFVNLGIYLGVGLIYALVRVFFYGRFQINKANEYKIKHPTWDYEIDRRGIKENVFRWWLLWPISLINWVIKDVVRDVYNFAYDKLAKVFNFIFDLGVKSVPEVPKKKTDVKS